MVMSNLLATFAADTTLLGEIGSSIGDLAQWFDEFASTLGLVLTAAAVVYATFIGWRAFKAATNKV